MTSKKNLKSAFESMLFVWGQPLDVKTAADVCNINRQEAYDCFKELQEEYEQEGRGIRIREVNGAFQFATTEENADYIERLCTPVKTKRLSQSALEVLAIMIGSLKDWQRRSWSVKSAGRTRSADRSYTGLPICFSKILVSHR